MKKLVSNIFQFNRTERMGIIALAVVLTILILVNSFLHLIIPAPKYNFSQQEHLLKEAPPEKQPNNVGSSTPVKENDSKQTQPTAAVKIIELNTADSLALLSLDGIGPVFAGRIVKYRNLLGGFAKKEQLLDVYGFDKERYDLISPYVAANGKVTQINLNTCTFKELNKHPYIEYDLTKAIFNLRKKLGKFSSVDDIKQIDLVDEKLYNKIAPYLTTQ